MLDDVNFHTGSAQVNPDPTLDGIASALEARPSARIRLVGHTDESGARARNQQLSTSRAAAVKMYLVERGVAPGSIQVSGRGSSQPNEQGDSPEARAANRRVELVVTAR